MFLQLDLVKKKKLSTLRKLLKNAMSDEDSAGKTNPPVNKHTKTLNLSYINNTKNISDIEEAGMVKGACSSSYVRGYNGPCCTPA